MLIGSGVIFSFISDQLIFIEPLSVPKSNQTNRERGPPNYDVIIGDIYANYGARGAHTKLAFYDWTCMSSMHIV